MGISVIATEFVTPVAPISIILRAIISQSGSLRSTRLSMVLLKAISQTRRCSGVKSLVASSFWIGRPANDAENSVPLTNNLIQYSLR